MKWHKLIHIHCAIRVLEMIKATEYYSYQVQTTITSGSVKGYVPNSWTSLVRIKSEYYRACSHYHLAECLLTLQAGGRDEIQLSNRVKEALQYVHLTPDSTTTTLDVTLPATHQERVLLGKARLPQT